MWFSVNRRIYIHESTLFKLREIKDQNSLSSDDKVFRYLITCHDYLCLVERMANPVESELLRSNGQLASGTSSAIRNEVHAQHNDSQLASGGISEPCSNSSRIISGGNSHFIEAPFAADTWYKQYSITCTVGFMCEVQIL